MQNRIIYEYAIVRFVPLVERGERINVGLIVFSKPGKFLKIKFHLDETRITALAPEADLALLQQYLKAWERVCSGKEAGPIGELEPHVRFRWLTASRSTIIQSSRVHPGKTRDFDQTLLDLFNKFVL